MFPRQTRLKLRPDACWAVPDQALGTRSHGSPETSVHCGLPPRDVIVHGCTGADLTWLADLDGLMTWEHAVTRAHTMHADRAGALVTALMATGGLDDMATMPDAWRLAQHRLSRDRASLLIDGYTPWQANDRVDQRHSTIIAVVGTGALAELTALRCTAAGLDCRVFPAAAEVGLEASAPAQVRPPATRLAVLVEPFHPLVVDRVDSPWHAIDHLPLRCWGGMARVGPLIRPGQTSCLRCAHLHAKDRYPQWMTRSWQAARAMRRADAAGDGAADVTVADTAVALAVRIIRAFCDEPSADELGRVVAPHAPGRDDESPRRVRVPLGTAFDIAVDNLLPTPVPQPSHPLCGCQWDGLVHAAEDA